MSKETRTRAVVVKAQPYGESDLVVSVLTGEHGVVRGFAKGALKSRKRFAGCFEPFTELDLSLVLKGDSLARLVSADIIEAHLGVRERLDRIQAGAVMLETALVMEVPAPERAAAFNLVVSIIKQLENSASPMELCAVFIIRYLDIAGFGISAGHCSSCGRAIKGAAVYAGGEGLKCTDCDRGGMELTAGLMAFIRRAESTDDDKLTRLRLANAVVVDFFGFAGKYISALSGKKLKSLSGIVYN